MSSLPDFSTNHRVFILKTKQIDLARIRLTNKCKFMAHKKTPLEHKREKHPAGLQREGWLKGFNFFKVEIYRILVLFFAVGGLLESWRLLMSRPMREGGWSTCLSVLLSGLLQAQVGSPWGQQSGHGRRKVTWKYLYFCWFGAIPPALPPWRFTVLNFLCCLKALNKGRFVEDLYEARAHIWSIFQRGKIKGWTWYG